jgi:proteasome lid subunit RPN8/RPN11
VIEDLLDAYPREACGILLNKRGKLEWFPCENVAEDDEEFKISASDYIRASLQGDIHAIVHSHPDSSPEPSEADKQASDFLGIPYWIYAIPSCELYVYEPKRKKEPLLGKEYQFGKNDCYSLVRDYYKELDIDLPTIPFEDDFWLKGINYFDDLQDAFGFVTVDEPQEHDMIIFNVISDIPNHCGVYLGEDIFMHHAVDRLSCRESLHSFWGRYVTRYIRCKKFI